MPARRLGLVLALSCAPLCADVPGLDGGYAKLRWLGSSYPHDSIFAEAWGDTGQDQGADLRLKFSASRQRLALHADYQLIGQFGDSQELPAQVQGLLLTPPPVPTDQRRWWDLTHKISDNDDRTIVQRLGRLQ